MTGILRVEVSGATKEELKKQLEEVIQELDKLNLQPRKQFSMGPQRWKMPSHVAQAWKVAPAASAAWKVGPSQYDPTNPKAGTVAFDPQKRALGGPTWKMTYET